MKRRSDDRQDVNRYALNRVSGGSVDDDLDDRTRYAMTEVTRSIGTLEDAAVGAVGAADAYDRDHGIVRVDCGSDDTVERVAEVIDEAWTRGGDAVFAARAVLSELRNGGDT